MKSRVLQVRMTEELYSCLEAKAKVEGVKVSETARRLIQGGLLSQVPVEAFKSDAPIGVAESPHSGFDPKSDDPRRGPKILPKEPEKVAEAFKPDPRLSKEFQTRGKGKKGKKK